MSYKKIFLILVVCLSAMQLQAQELQARVTIQAQRVASTVNKKIFTTLQNQLTNFLNSRKWTDDNYKQQEKIVCNFVITITESPETDIYKANLSMQSIRPVYNSTYQSAIINYQDVDFTFKYIEYQPIEFVESRIQGTDPNAANLTATIAYYVYIMLGFDYDSFSPKGGITYFQKAQNIVNNAPESRNISGWRTFDGLRNRYWLADNLNNTKFNIIHDIIYTYYRKGLDMMYENEQEARKNITSALSRLLSFNMDNPNTMILQFFMQGKSQELIGIYKNAPGIEKQRVVEILSRLDVSNINTYKQELK